MFLRKYNTLTVTGTTAIRIPIIKRGVVDFAVSADWTPAAGDVKIAIDGAAASNVTNLPTAVAMGNTAYWEFILTAAELTCKSCVVTVADSTTKAVEDQAFLVETFGHPSAMYQADLSAANLPANVVQISGDGTAADNLEAAADGTGYNLGGGQVVAASVTGAVGSVTGAVGSVTGNVGGNVLGSVATIAASGISAASFAAGAITATVIATDAIGADEISAAAVTKIQTGLATPTNITAATGITVATIGANVITASALATDAVNEIVDQVWDEILSGHAIVGSTGAALSAAGGSGDPWSTAVPGAYGAGTAGHTLGTYIDAAISSRMATYTQPTGFLAATFPGTVASTTNITAASGVTISGTTTTLDALQTAQNAAHGAGSWATATGFSTHSAADVWSAATRTLTAFGFTVTTANAADVTAILEDTGTTIPAQITGLNNISIANVATGVTTALTTALTEGYRATNATGSVRDLLYEINQGISEFVIAGTVKTVRRLDGAATAKIYTLNDGTTPTGITETT